MGGIVEIAREFCEFAGQSGDIYLLAVATELKGFLPSMTTVVHNARRAQIQGETVPVVAGLERQRHGATLPNTQNRVAFSGTP